jgi:hypothetical protein
MVDCGLAHHFKSTMTDQKPPAPPAPNKRAAARAANRAENPYLDKDLYVRMRDYTEREAAISKELKAIVERGAGKRGPDPRTAHAIEPLRGMVKKGLSLGEMLARIAAGTEKGLWEPWLTAFGLELRSVNYTGTPRNACIALDIGDGAKAHALFAKAGVPNWRSLVAEDCAELKVQKGVGGNPEQAHAIFYIERANS